MSDFKEAWVPPGAMYVGFESDEECRGLYFEDHSGLVHWPYECDNESAKESLIEIIAAVAIAGWYEKMIEEIVAGKLKNTVAGVCMCEATIREIQKWRDGK